jgi:hypothetical protein
MIQLTDIHPHWYYSCPESMPFGQSSISYPLPVLDPLPVLQSRVAPSNTRRNPSAFELPSSSAPTAINWPLNQHNSQIYVVNSGLTRLQNGHIDTYEPGTQEGRAYLQGLSLIYQPNSIVDAATATAALMESTIEVEEDPILEEDSTIEETQQEEEPQEEEPQEEELNWELDSEEEELEALELKRQESTDWRSLPHKYLVYNDDYTPLHSEELNALGQKEVFDTILNKDGYLYHGQQEPRSKKKDQYELTTEQLLQEEARKAVVQVKIPLLSLLPVQHKRKRAPSKKQQQLDKEVEERYQDQHQKRQRELLEARKYLELKDIEHEEVEKSKEAIARFRKRFAR